MPYFCSCRSRRILLDSSLLMKDRLPFYTPWGCFYNWDFFGDISENLWVLHQWLCACAKPEYYSPYFPKSFFSTSNPHPLSLSSHPSMGPGVGNPFPVHVLVITRIWWGLAKWTELDLLLNLARLSYSGTYMYNVF